MAQILSPVRMEALKFQNPVLTPGSRIPAFPRTSSSWNLIGRGAKRRAISRIKVATEGSSSVADDYYAVLGMDFYVVLERPGYRVGRRRRCKSRVGIQHRVTKDDAMKWFQVKYEGVILNKSQNITG